MGINARFVHTNIVARDWKRLAEFYERVFNCGPMPPERDLAGEWLDELTGMSHAHIRGVHLRLPGYGDEGPTLEIFQYDREEERPKTAVNRPGLAHIAFSVDDVEEACDRVIREGGDTVGSIVTLEIPGAGALTVVYAVDPEGNIIELQHWS